MQIPINWAGKTAEISHPIFSPNILPIPSGNVWTCSRRNHGPNQSRNSGQNMPPDMMPHHKTEAPMLEERFPQGQGMSASQRREDKARHDQGPCQRAAAGHKIAAGLDLLPKIKTCTDAQYKEISNCDHQRCRHSIASLCKTRFLKPKYRSESQSDASCFIAGLRFPLKSEFHSARDTRLV